ncbi:hypothetical protein [Amphritea sp.]|uniref:hypothetical protein n=1 Tax=Amphritea sp. TaxID=1872502 RepID=UPI003D0A0C21
MSFDVVMVIAVLFGCMAQALVIWWDYKLESGFNWLSCFAGLILLSTIIIGLYALTDDTRLAGTDYYSIQAALLSLLGSVWAAVVAVGLHKGADQDQPGPEGLEARIEALEQANVQSKKTASKFYQVAVILLLSVISTILSVVV